MVEKVVNKWAIRLIPRPGDLTFYSWSRGKADLSSTDNFQTEVKGEKYKKYR